MNTIETQYEELHGGPSIVSETYTQLRTAGVGQDLSKLGSTGVISLPTDDYSTSENVYETVDPTSIEDETNSECFGRPWIKWIILSSSLLAVVSAIIVLVLYVYWNSNSQCTEDLCGNHGRCILHISNMTECICSAGYVGKHCDQVITDCEDKPCGSHGECLSTLGPGEPKCRCHEWYTGESCKTIIAPEFHKVRKLRNYSFPYVVGGITDTSTGELLLVEWNGQKAMIYTTAGQPRITLDIPGQKYLWGAARENYTLFVSDARENIIHMITENNTYIGHINTEIAGMSGIAITDSTIWVTTSDSSVHKLDLDADNNIIASEVIVHNSDIFNYPVSISVMAGLVAVVCHYSHNIHILNTTGHMLVPPVGKKGKLDGQLSGPRDLVQDPAGRMYVADYGNYRVALFSSTGEFLRNLVTEVDGLAQPPVALFIKFNILYIITDKPVHMYVVELEQGNFQTLQEGAS